MASQRGRIKAGGKPTGPPAADDIFAVVRRDSKKALRMKELLIMQKEIKTETDKLEEKDEDVLVKHAQQ